MDDALNTCNPNVQFKSVKHSIAQSLHTGEPEAESFVYSPEHRSTANAIQPEKMDAVLASEFACVAQRSARDIPSLLLRVHSNFVNERGQTIRHFRPKEAVFELKPKNCYTAFIIESRVIHAPADMLTHRRFSYFRRGPKRVAFFHQAGCRRTQHVGYKACLLRVSLEDLHG